MNLRLVLNTLGDLLLLVATCMAIPTIMASISHTKDFIPFVISFCITVVAGFIFRYLIQVQEKTFSFREAFAISAFAWLVIGFFGCLPMFITDYFNYQHIFNYAHKSITWYGSLTNSYFEAMSGFTSTGATLIYDVESLPRPLLFWRCFHNAIGGMGILLLFVAVLPSIGAAGKILMRSESTIGSGNTSYLYPKIANLAKSLWLVYISMTIVLCLLLMIAGMDTFDALCHSFSTMGTGGFSTKNNSIQFFNSLPIEIILAAFMFLSSLNCLLIRSLFNGDLKTFFSNTEMKSYVLILLFSAITIFFSNYLSQEGKTVFSELRNSLFTVISISTSTGFTTVDYDQWHHYGKIMVVVLMIIGGCASSTSGGLKVIRVVIIVKYIQREIKKLIRPHGVFPILIQNQPIDNKAVESTIGYCLTYLFVLLGLSALITLIEHDAIDSFSGVLTSLSNIGPGLGSVGPTKNFAHLTYFSKFILALCMAFGRLEMMAFFVLFSPSTWKK